MKTANLWIMKIFQGGRLWIWPSFDACLCVCVWIHAALQGWNTARTCFPNWLLTTIWTLTACSSRKYCIRKHINREGCLNRQLRFFYFADFIYWKQIKIINIREIKSCILAVIEWLHVYLWYGYVLYGFLSWITSTTRHKIALVEEKA